MPILIILLVSMAIFGIAKTRIVVASGLTGALDICGRHGRHIHGDCAVDFGTLNFASTELAPWTPFFHAIGG